LFSVELTQDEAIHFEDLEFITDHFDDADAIVGGMACSRSSLLHAILEDSPSEDNSTFSEGESFSFPIPKMCNVVTSSIPIVTMPPPEETSTL
jgi:hypothetical protein